MRDEKLRDEENAISKLMSSRVGGEETGNLSMSDDKLIDFEADLRKIVSP